ncbi:hypothetical protein [Algibacter sp. R77976]|uniref:hypothetical protein n=1 Tax=Algibacter sp. R77976 TaxID=3093873 RepID=UPI0037CBC9D5
MKSEITFDNVRFWLDQHVIHCSFNERFDKRFHEIEDAFFEVVTAFIIGNYKPILIDLTKVNRFKAYHLYRFISSSAQLRSFVISKSFLVKSFNLKLLFELYNIGDDGVIPTNISTDFNKAIQFSEKRYLEFNAI